MGRFIQKKHGQISESAFISAPMVEVEQFEHLMSEIKNI
jgi:hypothetical protein